MGHSEITRVLLSKRSAVANAQDKNGCTSALKLLGSHLVVSGWTALHWACACGEVESAHVLAQAHKPTLNVVNLEQETPLHLAAREGSLTVVKLLVTQRERQQVLPLVRRTSLSKYMFPSVALLFIDLPTARRQSTMRGVLSTMTLSIFSNSG